MRAQGEVGLDRFGDEIGALAFLARIFVLAEVRVGPAVKGAVFYAGEIVGHQLVAEHVALVDHGPELFGCRLPVQSYRVSQSVGEYAHGAAVEVCLQDGGAPAVLGVSHFFVDVAGRADADIELFSVSIDVRGFACSGRRRASRESFRPGGRSWCRRCDRERPTRRRCCRHTSGCRAAPCRRRHSSCR